MAAGTIYRTVEGRGILLGFYDGVISRWVFRHENADIPTRFGETRVVTAGRRGNPALLLLHGSASNVLGWAGAMPAYMNDFYVIAPDILGEAGRSAAVRPSW